MEPDLGLTAANFVPNDPFYPPYQQNKHYGAINLPAAWELTTGDPNVVVQIVDTGVQRNHPDLQANIWQNPSETDCSNGVDDDGNGYVDDCYGWDHRDDDELGAGLINAEKFLECVGGVTDPTPGPTPRPTLSPTPRPTAMPTARPTHAPTPAPTHAATTTALARPVVPGRYPEVATPGIGINRSTGRP